MEQLEKQLQDAVSLYHVLVSQQNQGLAKCLQKENDAFSL